MIVPMQKFVLVILDKDVNSALAQIRALGIAHVELNALNGNSEAYSELKSKVDKLSAAEQVLVELDKDKSIASKAPDYSYRGKSHKEMLARAEFVADRLESCNVSIKAKNDQLAERLAELKRLEPWGDFDPSLLENLLPDGTRIRLYEGMAKDLDKMAPDIDYVRLSSPRGRARIAVISEGDVPQFFVNFDPHGERLSAVQNEIVQIQREIQEKTKELQSLRAELPLIADALKIAKAELVIERLKASMPVQDHLATLTGFVPAKEAPRLLNQASKGGWAAAIGDPADDELPPTKLENNSVVRTIQPVFDFLGTVPNYHEYDISSWFLVFFSIFFAMIFGDGGYGLVMLVASLLLITKAKHDGKPVADFVKLLVLLSASTIVWGAVTATWFAIPWDSLPGLLQRLSIHAINGAPRVEGELNSDMNVRILCFIFGAIQLSIAHLKNVKRDFPDLKFMSQIGSLFLVVGMFELALYLVIDANRFPIQPWVLGVLGIGFVLIVVFSNWNGNLGKSLLATLTNFIPTILGVVSVFADIVSYIRLWAVGLTGLAISQTVNGMALSILGTFGGAIVSFIIKLVLCCVLLIAGHSLNIAMSVLSVVVHGIRLNILEFSSHLGMEWSGYKYEPLSELALGELAGKVGKEE